MVAYSLEDCWELVKYAFSAPSVVTAVPVPIRKKRRVYITDCELSGVQRSELVRSVHHYNLFLDDWLPHIRKLDCITAMHNSPDSNKMYYKSWIDFKLDGKCFRMQLFIERYKPYARTIEEISLTEFKKAKILVFDKAVLAGWR